MARTGPVTLLEAVGQYIGSLKGGGDARVHQELQRFVQWCGPHRLLSELRPDEVGEYAEQVSGGGNASETTRRLQAVKDFLAYARKQGLLKQGLAAHVRVRKASGGSRRRRSARAGASETVELTAEGYAQLQEELKKLKSERDWLATEIRRAAADKDVRENAPLEAARERQGRVQSRIREIEQALQRAVVIGGPTPGANVVRRGSQVVVEALDSGRRMTYTLVSSSEANSLAGKISDQSPLGRALQGAWEGQEVEVETPRGRVRYRVVRVSS